MAGFRFIHAADLHLDSPFRGMSHLPAPIRERVKESTFDALQRLVELAIRVQAAFVLVAGDVYDAADRSLRAQLRFQQAAEKLAERGIRLFVVHGNHDPADGRSAKLAWPDSVHFFGTDEVEEVPVFDGNGKRLVIVQGISYPTASVTANLAAKFKASAESRRLGRDDFRIGLLHCNVDGDARHDNYAPCTRQELLRAGIDYWALGHVHTRQILHAGPDIVYPGNIQGRSMRETDARGCYVVDVAEDGRTALSFHPLDGIRWLERPVPLDGATTEQEVKDRIAAAAEQAGADADGRSAIVRLTLTGRCAIHKQLRQGGLAEELAAAFREEESERARRDGQSPFLWIQEIRTDTGAMLDSGQLLEEQSFLGDLLRYSAQLAGNGTERDAFLEEALGGMLAHPKLARLLRPMMQEEWPDWLKQAEGWAVDWLADEEESG